MALTALAPASLYRQFEHYVPKSRGRPVLRFSLTWVAATLVILAAAATSN
jgi:hypothetical protein